MGGREGKTGEQKEGLLAEPEAGKKKRECSAIL